MKSEDQAVLEAIAEAVKGGEYAPPNGEHLLMEAVVSMGWSDGEEYSTSYMRLGSSWGTRWLGSPNSGPYSKNG